MNPNLPQPDPLEIGSSSPRTWWVILIVFLLLIGLALAIWLYLPQFQVYEPFLPIATQFTPTPTPYITETFEVIAAKGWQDTGVQVNSGDRLEMIYIEGLWTGKTENNNYTGPEGGKPSQDYPCSPISHKETGYNALIGKIWYGKPFMVGRHFIGTALISGTLYLRMNDCDEWLADNEGSVYVTIQISR